MNQVRLVLALLTVSSALNANAQFIDDTQPGVSGGICQVGQHCPPGVPDLGGGAPVDPSPYDPRPGRPNDPGRPNYPGNPGYPGQPQYPNYPGSDRHEIYVGRRVTNENMDLLRLAGLDSWSNRGDEIDSVEVIAQPGAVRAELNLNADGYIVASQNYPSNYNVLNPNRHLVIGQNLNQLSLGVRGTLQIDRIVINLRGGYNPNPNPPPYGNQTAVGYINQTFYSQAYIDIARVANLYRYQGYRIQSVTVRGRNLDYRGSARVNVNGITAGRVDLAYGGETISMPINVVVGQNLQSLDLQVMPSVQIDRVEVQLSRY